ncbi:MAG: hypothetical protein QOG75_671 [Mycobacterium sp.]|jgi:hypothetical protein|nr:hypothetical protein [Mycobacterium sp.]
MSDRLSIDYDAWHGHADEWDEEGAQARARMSVDPETLEAARHQFGRLGSSTIGASYAEVLQARHELGQRLGSTAEGIGAHIRRNLQTYADQEAANTRTLST